MHEAATENDDVENCVPTALHIPTEVCENIIDMLYSYLVRDTFQDIATLHSCALVCRAWRVRSQKMLFYKIQLSDGPSIHRLSTILDAGQHLRGYVYEVAIIGYYLQTTASILVPFPAVFAGKLTNVRRVDVIHLQNWTSWYPKTSDPPLKAKPLPHIPLHPRFPAFLSSFTAISFLVLSYTKFQSFKEFVRMVNALPNLKELQCEYVRWITASGSYPGADFTQPPDWATGGSILPPFAPKLQGLTLCDIAMSEAEKLVLKRGPYLMSLDTTIPLSEDEELTRGHFNLSPCTGLQTLYLSFTPGFSMDQHAGIVRELLTSWNPHRPQPSLVLRTYRDWLITRRGFADVMRGLSPIVEGWLQASEEPPSADDCEDHHRAQYRVVVDIYDSEDRRQWWSDHLDSCFPTWARLGRLNLNFETPQNEYFRWAEEVESLPSGH